MDRQISLHEGAQHAAAAERVCAVAHMREIIARQRNLITQLRDLNRPSAEAENLLTLFEQKLALCETDLANW